MSTRNTTILTSIIVLIGVALIGYSISHHSSITVQPRTFNLSEFGVALEVPATLSDLTYTASDQSENGPGMVLHMKVMETCEIGALYEIRKNAIKTSGTRWTEAQLEQFSLPQGNNPASVKEFTDFYLVFEPSQEPCAGDTEEHQPGTEKRLALWNSLVTAHYMSQ